MRRAWTLLLWAAACAGPSAARAPAPARAVLGQAPPRLAGPVLNQARTGRSDFDLAESAGEGRVVILDFVASWCEPCWMQLPHVLELKKKHAVDAVMIVVDEDAVSRAVAAEALTNRFDVSSPVVADVDGGIATAYGADNLPTLWVLDREGRLAWQEVGFKGDTIERLDAILTELTGRR